MSSWPTPEYKIKEELSKKIYNLNEVERLAGLPRTKLRKVISGRRHLTYTETQALYAVLKRKSMDLQVLIIELHNKLEC